MSYDYKPLPGGTFLVAGVGLTADGGVDMQIVCVAFNESAAKRITAWLNGEDS